MTPTTLIRTGFQSPAEAAAAALKFFGPPKRPLTPQMLHRLERQKHTRTYREKRKEAGK